MNETKDQIVEILERGRTCVWNKSTNEVVEVADEKSEHTGTVIIPPQSVFVFKLMEEYTSKVDDFEKQSQLMESLSYERPFATFKDKVYKLRLQGDWQKFRRQRFVEWLENTYEI